MKNQEITPVSPFGMQFLEQLDTVDLTTVCQLKYDEDSHYTILLDDEGTPVPFVKSNMAHLCTQTVTEVGKEKPEESQDENSLGHLITQTVTRAKSDDPEGTDEDDDNSRLVKALMTITSTKAKEFHKMMTPADCLNGPGNHDYSHNH